MIIGQNDVTINFCVTSQYHYWSPQKPEWVNGNTDILSTPVDSCPFHSMPIGHLWTPVPFDPWPWWQSGLPFPRYNLALKIQGQRSRSKVPQSAQHPVDSFPLFFTSGHPIDSHLLRSMTTRSPISEIQFDLAHSRSKVKVKVQGPVDSFLSCLTSGHPIDSRPFRSKTIGPPIPEMPFDLENSRSKVKVQ